MMVTLIIGATLLTTVPMILICGGLFLGLFGIPLLGTIGVPVAALLSLFGVIDLGGIFNTILGWFGLR